jgi:hypothetical protein
MHKQKTAEQERQSMKLLATGKYEAAEQEKIAAIQLAKGKREEGDRGRGRTARQANVGLGSKLVEWE